MVLSADEDRAFVFDWDDCRAIMKEKIQSLAEGRYLSMLKERRKIEKGGDPD